MGGSILLPSKNGENIQNFYFSINLKLSGLNHRKHMGNQEDIHGDVHNAGANDRHNCVSSSGMMNNSNREQSTNDISDGNAMNVAFYDNVLTIFANSDLAMYQTLVPMAILSAT